MKTLRLRKIDLINMFLLSMLLLGAAFLIKPRTTATARTAAIKPPFTVRSYGGKCLEFGMPRTIIEQTTPKTYPVFIADCRGTAAQQVRVEELTDRPGHLVILRAGYGVIGKKVNLVVGPKAASTVQEEDKPSEQASLDQQALISIPDQTPLEVQPYDVRRLEEQTFVLDGDSIILAADRSLVVEVQNNRGANRTPLVLGKRDLDDSEFWTFTASDGSGIRPTSGFVQVTQAYEFEQALEKPTPGTVIEIHPDARIDLTGYPTQRIPDGVTIRGDRGGLRPGPELHSKYNPTKTMLEIVGSDVRITGLRLRGPTRDGREPD